MNGIDIEIEKVIRSRRTTLALEITEQGTLVVRAPLATHDATIHRIVEKHRTWIKTQTRRAKARRFETPPKTFVEGERFPYLGVPYPLRLVEAQETPLKLTEEFLLLKSARPNAREIFERWYRTKALTFITDTARRLAERHAFRFERVKITGARKRWGSCSPKGTLNFSWRLILAPPPVVEYVVIHELVHLVERNHSRRFWRRVESLMPDYKTQRAWLKENGHRLTL